MTPQERGCALVTGGSRGIGAATARALAGDGWTVAVNFRRDEAEARRVVAQIVGAGGRASPFRADLSSPQQQDELFARVEAELGRVLVLVNNAGVTSDNLSPLLTDADWERVVSTNLTAAFRLIRRALKPMLRARFGRVVNMASVVGLRANPGQANYAAAKAGLVGLTRTVAAEVASRGVTVNAVAPGVIATDMTADLGESVLASVPARRAGTPDEVAACVRFLASAEAAYVTGATLVVDGGLTA